MISLVMDKKAVMLTIAPTVQTFVLKTVRIIFPDCCETFLVCCEKFPVCCESFPNCYQTFSVNDNGQDKVK